MSSTSTTSTTTSSVLIVALAVTSYLLAQSLRPFLSLYLHTRRAQRIGLPVKVLPVPQGAFSFFAFQLARRLPDTIRIPFSSLSLEIPGVRRLHAILNMGRPDGYGLHAELGDVFVTVNPMGITLVVADPDVAAYINGRRSEFPKPPNTGAIINLYGRNVINAERNDVQGDVWRLHRRVTGAAFSERIHAEVWAEAGVQADFMLSAWQQQQQQQVAGGGGSPFVVRNLGADSLRLGMNVITGAAYGQKLAWSQPPSGHEQPERKHQQQQHRRGNSLVLEPVRRPFNPPSATPTTLTYRESLEEVTQHLMPLFLTPHWALRLAPRGSTWGRAWEAYEAFGGYMRGMLDAQAAKMAGDADTDKDDGAADENLLAALLRAREEGPDGLRPMMQEEIVGNAFIFLFAGHETTANTLHYALLRLALHPEIQNSLLEEIDALNAEAEAEDQPEGPDYAIFEKAVWCRAVMNETLRVHTPTGIVNKYAPKDSRVSYRGQQFVIPAETRIAINGTGIHFNPDVWGPAEMDWWPARWVEEAAAAAGSRPVTPVTPASPGLRSSSSSRPGFPVQHHTDNYPTPPMTPQPSSSSLSSGGIATQESAGSQSQLLAAPFAFSVSSSSRCASPAAVEGEKEKTRQPTLAKPRKGTFLPFSEGNRACSGKKFAAVEFVRVVLVLLREWRVEILDQAEGWGAERVLKVLAGRKAGALTLQPPESVPVRFVRRIPAPAPAAVIA
ncbi:cytochrome P450 [Auriculariales sp. MPI-PUGE-AT-0066]|nr:cytochrome P450 [Auriculariales sp. MPI-PUGE-AT-0066]